MKLSTVLQPALFASVLLLAGSVAQAAEAPKLAAPVYKGAVPAIPAQGVANAPRTPGDFGGTKALDCRGLEASRGSDGKVLTAGATGDSGPWCFLTRDSLKKVKAFYDQSVGATDTIHGSWNGKPVQGYAVLAERAWFPGTGEDSPPGFEYRGVSLHALPAAPVKGQDMPVDDDSDDAWQGQGAHQFYSTTQHFGPFLAGVDWFGEPGKRKPAELDAVYRKYAHLESAFFQRRGPVLEPVDRTLSERYAKQQTELTQAASGAGMPSPAQLQQMRQGQPALGADIDATPEDAEFEAIMQRKPAVARKYVELTRKVGELMQQGKWDQADAVDEELEALVEANPELAALEDQEEERQTAASSTHRAAENQQQAAQTKQLDQANWGTWMEYVQAADKEAFYTLIVIDTAFSGTEKDYSRDRALFAEATRGQTPHQNIWGFSYQQPWDADQTGSVASKPEPEKKAGVKGAAKKGLGALRDLL